MRNFCSSLTIFLILLMGLAAQAMTTEECAAQKGKITNRAGDHDEIYCPENSKNIGNIEGVKCPCVCCVEDATTPKKQ
jgi:hypothetical protein